MFLLRVSAHVLLDRQDYDKPIQAVLVEKTEWGCDYTFECIGNVQVGLCQLLA